MSEATKTVQGYFREKQVTRDEYINEWRQHFAQLMYLANSIEEFNELDAMKKRLIELAGNKWDSLKS